MLSHILSVYDNCFFHFSIIGLVLSWIISFPVLKSDLDTLQSCQSNFDLLILNDSCKYCEISLSNFSHNSDNNNQLIRSLEYLIWRIISYPNYAGKVLIFNTLCMRVNITTIYSDDCAHNPHSSCFGAFLLIQSIHSLSYNEDVNNFAISIWTSLPSYQNSLINCVLFLFSTYYLSTITLICSS